MYLKEKNCKRIKRRGCANWRNQRDLYTREESSSPTVATEPVFISLIVDAKQHRDVATSDVVGAYLLALMDDYVLIKLTGTHIDTLCDISHEYVKYVTMENGKRVLYLRLNKVLYGCMQSAILWYDIFKGRLEEMGFKLKKYDPCVANLIIAGEQCTI